jgi:hypothetical protein
MTHRRVQVEFDAPALAIVNIETGMVERVVVWCEFLKQQEGEFAIVSAGTEEPVSATQRARAQKIVDSEWWPTWDFD